MLVRIYTDGSARGNPDGPGGYGAVLKYVDPKGALHEREFSQGYVRTTNNRMELTVRGSEYGILAEGDVGMLSFQGTRYL